MNHKHCQGETSAPFLEIMGSRQEWSTAWVDGKIRRGISGYCVWCGFCFSSEARSGKAVEGRRCRSLQTSAKVRTFQQESPPGLWTLGAVVVPALPLIYIWNGTHLDLALLLHLLGHVDSKMLKDDSLTIDLGFSRKKGSFANLCLLISVLPYARAGPSPSPAFLSH